MIISTSANRQALAILAAILVSVLYRYLTQEIDESNAFVKFGDNQVTNNLVNMSTGAN